MEKKGIAMIQPVVIYDSKYGSTKRYAQWIAEALSCPVLQGKNSIPKTSPTIRPSSTGAGFTPEISAASACCPKMPSFFKGSLLSFLPAGFPTRKTKEPPPPSGSLFPGAFLPHFYPKPAFSLCGAASTTPGSLLCTGP